MISNLQIKTPEKYSFDNQGTKMLKKEAFEQNNFSKMMLQDLKLVLTISKKGVKLRPEAMIFEQKFMSKKLAKCFLQYAWNYSYVVVMTAQWKISEKLKVLK